MNNNDVLRRLRYSLNLSDEKMVAIILLGGVQITTEEMRNFVRKETDEAAVECPDRVFEAFLDGLIIDRRGPPKPRSRPAPQRTYITNNSILRKLRIALMMKDSDVLETLKAGGQTMSKSELSALFRRPDHKHYRECGDQAFRKFLKGLSVRMRGES